MTIELKVGDIFKEQQIEKSGLNKIGFVGDGALRYDDDSKIYIFTHYIVNEEGNFYELSRILNRGMSKEQETKR